MCGPIAVISSLVGAASTVAGGVASNRAAKFNSQVQQNNAVIARNKAKQEQAVSELEIVRNQRRVRQVFGEQKTGFGAGNIQTDSGSALDVLANTIEQGELDTQIIRFNSEQTQQDLRFSADNLDAQSQLTRQSGKFGLGGSVLSGASQLGGLFG